MFTYIKNEKLKNSSKSVVLGMSGGVDSSVAAAVLKDAGFNVIGIFMKNWEEVDEHGVCNASKEFEDVVKVCQQLDIPYHSIEFVKEYQDLVFKNFLEEYQKGNTPNPDILCNKEIKFKVFYEQALAFGADYFATGHYAQNPIRDNKTALVKAKDLNKDQTYFLYAIKEDVLKKVLFPIGDLLKPDLRIMASKLNLATKDKKDSTGICFIGERNFRNFLSGYLKDCPGNFSTLNGDVVGKHRGVQFYTIGQRKGLGLGGEGSPWFVIKKDVDKNIVYVERGENHPALFSSKLTANSLSFVNELDLNNPLKCFAKIRYRQPDQECVVTKTGDDTILVEFLNPQRAMCVGQSVVLYLQDQCLGGGIINTISPPIIS